MNFDINFGLILNLSAAKPHRCRRPLIFNEAAAIVRRPGSAQGGKPACELPAKPAKGIRGLRIARAERVTVIACDVRTLC